MTLRSFSMGLFFLLCSPLLIFAQKDLKIAEKAYKNTDYYTAVEYFERAFEDKKLIENAKKATDAYYKYAESCRFSYNFSKAEQYYKKVVESGPEKDRFPLVDFYYAYTLKHNAKYPEAQKGFEAFLAKEAVNAGIKKLQHQAKQEIKACELAVKLYKSPVPGVDVAQLGDNVNTIYSDFAPHLVGNDLYYSSLKFEQQAKRRTSADDPTKKHLYGKLMVAKENGKKRGALIPGLNQKYTNVGNSTLSPDGKRLFYTVCDKDENYDFQCKIFVAERKGRDWSTPVELPSNINAKNSTTTHPCIGFDSIRMKEVLFFASNREGGYGKMDIWAAEIIGRDDYSAPYNLGPVVNTEGDEATPFFHTTTQILYFSSTWHPGLGGYDIFKTNQTEKDNWKEPLNVGVPLNSAANDLYFYITPNVDTFGYFSSNRPGSQILTGESCCNDIYALVLPKDLTPMIPTDVIASVEPDVIPEPEPVVVKEPEPVAIPEPEPIVVKEPEPVVPEPVAVPEPIVMEPIPTVEELADYLPLTLYFHNDEPDSRTRAVTTKKTYTESYVAYMALKNLYKKEYSAQFAGLEKQTIEQTKVEEFFDKTVKKEYDRMNECLESLLKVLANGEKIELHIRGFCSPRATTDYNANLAKRRIVSMKNQVASFKNGAFKKYLENGSLVFVELPIGETEAPEGISDDIKDPRNSIYSVEASQQRKIAIEAIQRQK